MEKSIQTKRLPAWLLLTAMLASAAALAVPALYLVTPALCAATLLLRNRVSTLMLLLLPPLAAMMLLYGGGALISGLCLVALGILPALVIGRTQLHRQGGFVSAAAAAACCIVALYCALCLPGVLSGTGAFTAIEQVMTESGELLRQMLTSIRTPETAQAVDLYLDSLARLEDSVALLLVPVICLFGCVLGLSNTLLFYPLTRRERETLNLLPLKRFCQWSIPQNVTTGLFALLLGSFVLMLSGAQTGEAVNATVTVLVGFPLVIQALALIDFLLQRKPRGLALKRTLVYVAAALLLPMSLSLLITLGCFEQLFHVRERMAASRPQPPMPPESGEGDGI